MPGALETLIRDKINKNGPIPLDVFMETALSHPRHGYYRTRDPFGPKGDFITAPEISQMFGEMIGAWTADLWQQMGSPSAFSLVECGPGRGTMMADLLRSTQDLKGFHESLNLHLIETSPVLFRKKIATGV